VKLRRANATRPIDSTWHDRPMQIAPAAVLFGALSATACSGPHAPYWIVETADGASSVLVGTMHSEADASVLAPELDDRLRTARTLLTEADVRAIPATDFIDALTLPDGVSVEGAVAPADWTAIGRALSGAIASDIDEARLQPWFLEGAIIDARLPRVERIDETLVARGATAQVPLSFFETWQVQVELLNGLGFDDGLDVLLTTARDPDAAVAEHLTWADAYAAGDLDAMTALAFDADAMAARPAYYEDVVFRHEGWIDQLEREVRNGDAFVAVGFMHLLTERGLPALLAERGFTVTPR
jgi:uncharacterized protein YbaP (TraB family)